MFSALLLCSHLLGYSLYPWVCALFLSCMSDSYSRLSAYVSPQMPLYVIGLPAAIAQVCSRKTDRQAGRQAARKLSALPAQHPG